MDEPPSGQPPAEGASVKKHSDSQNANGIALDPSPQKVNQQSANGQSSEILSHDGPSEHGSTDELLPYKMNSHRGGAQCHTHGIALIISISEFDNEPGMKRSCAPQDEQMLESCFYNLGYQPIVKRNLTKAQIIQIFKDGCKIDDTHDSFVACFVSHGGWDLTDYIYCRDLEKVTVRELAQHLRPNKCKPLVGKPKLFFISACRGKEPAQLVTAEGYPELQKAAEEMIPLDCDFYFSYATIPETTAYRIDKGPDPGSMYVKALSESLATVNAKKLDLHAMEMKAHCKQASDKQYLRRDKAGKFVRNCPEAVITLRGPVFFFDEAEANYSQYFS